MNPLSLFAAILFLAGVGFLPVGAWRAWSATSEEEGKKWLRVAGFGGGLLLAGGLLGGVLKVVSSPAEERQEAAAIPLPEPIEIEEENPEPVEEALAASSDEDPQQAEEAGDHSSTEPRVFDEGRPYESEGEKEESANSQQPEANGSPEEEPAAPKESPAAALAEAAAESFSAEPGREKEAAAARREAARATPIASSSSVDNQSQEATPSQLPTATSQQSIPNTAEIRFRGTSFSRDGAPVTELFVGERFRFNLAIENGDFFAWDLDTTIDADGDGLAENDFDALGQSPELLFETAGKKSLKLRAANAAHLFEKEFELEILERAPRVSFKILQDENFPARLWLDARETRWFSGGGKAFSWRLDGEEIELQEGEPPAGTSVLTENEVPRAAGWFLLPSRGEFEIECQAIDFAANGSNAIPKWHASASQKFSLDSLFSAEVILTKNFGVAPLAVQMRAHAGDLSSTGIDETKAAGFSWDFGDGSEKFSAPAAREVEHLFEEPGVFKIKLTAESSSGEKVSATKEVFISRGGAPVAFFKLPKESGTRSEIFSFDGGASKSFGDALDFSWDFGDGSPLKRGRRVSHRFEKTGRFRVRLTATDAGSGETGGLFSFFEREVEIRPVAQTAAFSWEKIGPLEYEFDASGSSDPDANIAKFSWDFGDGTNALSADPVVRHSFENAGEREVFLSVRDEDGLVDDVLKRVSVEAK